MPKLIPSAFQPTNSAAAPAGAAQESAEPRFRLAANAGAIIGLIGILMAFGHSFLAMSGEESLAQVNRELEYPKHKNLMRAGLIIFLYSMLFTSLVSFFAYAIIPDDVRPQYFDNLISGIAINLAGPTSLKLAIDLSQRFFTRHREERMAERHQNTDQTNQRADVCSEGEMRF